MEYVYIVLGAETGEWRNWVEGIFIDEGKAKEHMNAVEEADGGWNAYYILEGEVTT